MTPGIQATLLLRSCLQAVLNQQVLLRIVMQRSVLLWSSGVAQPNALHYVATRRGKLLQKHLGLTLVLAVGTGGISTLFRDRAEHPEQIGSGWL